MQDAEGRGFGETVPMLTCSSPACGRGANKEQTKER